MNTIETTGKSGTAHLCDWCDAPHVRRGCDETGAPYRACEAHYRQWIALHEAPETAAELAARIAKIKSYPTIADGFAVCPDGPHSGPYND